ncbi:MAG: phosphoglycerate kinase [Candidatus Raymondbacteria bacterium RifOxyA12_full_50_37]|nr:MAG: phosphoglycerate kinase [Candidatus Raymondbacteria bacterium RifOxyA12_full_50_37]OGJ93540.1 MAG: phosphoglycerate kinase [Candidatus Raymondbacteria bacterium RIFOXYA2_FULL_49_16]OGJ98810.1 MAG: phosphoglycerate kinase [Candidatus Raymondbacteria bacterium RIFOXYC2_FULL_50_21]OGP45659.1 MAG: phosphoglycerate kinase [Candidatus Raymondbacteria bacterium RIFOXYB2_FULL_49_35]
MAKLFIEDLDVRGKRVIVRTDFNVPVKDGRVEDDKRIAASLPTINYLLEKGAALILMSHLGRPDGKVKPEFSLKPVAEKLQELIKRPVKFLNDCVGPDVEKACTAMKPGDVILLENLRFHIEEEGKVKLDDGSKMKAKEEDVKAFRAGLTKLADIYVNDAFGTAHRDHSSMTGVTLPQRACGYLMKKELDFLGHAVENPKRPFVAILGGAKVSDKISVINNLLPKVDKLIIGGGMAFTFAKAAGFEIGASLCENDKVDLAKQIMATAGDKLMLQSDVLVTDKLDFKTRTIGAVKTVDAKGIPQGWLGIDIGPVTIGRFSQVVSEAKTVLWNGPMGVFEIEASSKGTFAIAQAMADATAKGATTVIGGGDSASAIKKAGLSKKVSHVSTGGGASLEFLEGKPLPGVAALSDA